MEKLLDEKTIARLLLSIPHKKSSPMDQIEVAEKLELLCKHIPRKEVARRLGINRASLRQSLHLLRLPKSIQQLIKNGRIGKETGYRISLLKDEREQVVLADAVIKHRLSSNEVKGIVQSLKKRNPDMPIEECIQLALKSRPIIKEEHLIVTKIQNATLQALERESERYNVVVDEQIRKIVEEILPPNSMASLKVADRIIMMSLEKDGVKAFKDKARQTGVRPSDLVEILIRKWLRKNEN